MFRTNKKKYGSKTICNSTRALNMTEEVLSQIRETIGKRRPESGGILGSSDGKTIDHYYFDVYAATSSGTYTMNTKALNAEIRRWNDNDIRFMGIIHSHPKGVTAPSSQDIANAKHIIDIVDVGGELMIPIVQVSDDLSGDINIYPYVVKRSVSVEKPQLNIVSSARDAKEQEKLRLLDERSKDRFVRIQEILPSDIMSRKKAVMIGCGTAGEQALALARSGVGNFVIFEGDVYEAANIAIVIKKLF